MHKDGKQYDKFILNGKTYDKFYLNNKQYGGGYVPFATPILDLDFQNNFIDKSPSGLTMVQGQGLPTFGLSGRKTGEYCANFNSLQSIKTTTNLPLNSDKVCIKFWMKTTQSALSIISETSADSGANNAFRLVLNTNSIAIVDHNIYNNTLLSNFVVNNGDWFHIIVSIDRSLGINQNKIFINGNLSFVQGEANNLSGNFGNHILNIGQRNGSGFGFNGSLLKYQAFREVPTDAQAMEMYQNDL